MSLNLAQLDELAADEYMVSDATYDALIEYARERAAREACARDGGYVTLVRYGARWQAVQYDATGRPTGWSGFSPIDGDPSEAYLDLVAHLEAVR